MKFQGGCYCKQVRYEVDGDPAFKAECLCRECQYMTGGGPNFFMMLPATAVKFTQGTPKDFKRTDIPNAVTRQFCPNCGTHLITVANGMFVLKVGSMDDPSLYGGPQAAIYTCDKQSFHAITPGAREFERLPG
jgi:hypothetical protein